MENTSFENTQFIIDLLEYLSDLNGGNLDELFSADCDWCSYEDEDYSRITNLIDHVIFNGKATIVFWVDGTKTVVKCTASDVMSKETGVAFAILKKFFGNTYYRQITKIVETCSTTEPTVAKTTVAKTTKTKTSTTKTSTTKTTAKPKTIRSTTKNTSATEVADTSTTD